jgi:hypothetical protein
MKVRAAAWLLHPASESHVGQLSAPRARHVAALLSFRHGDELPSSRNELKDEIVPPAQPLIAAGALLRCFRTPGTVMNEYSAG